MPKDTRKDGKKGKKAQTPDPEEREESADGEVNQPVVRRQKAPPRPKNSYMCFTADCREKNMFPGMSATDKSRLYGPLWKSMTLAQKAKFEKKAKEEKRLHSIKYPGYRYNPKQKVKGEAEASSAAIQRFILVN